VSIDLRTSRHGLARMSHGSRREPPELRLWNPVYGEEAGDTLMDEDGGIWDDLDAFSEQPSRSESVTITNV